MIERIGFHWMGCALVLGAILLVAIVLSGLRP